MLAFYCNTGKLSGESQQRTCSLREYISQSESKIYRTRKGLYRVARNFSGSLFLRISDFLCFAGTNFCD